jgi:anti-anti-sigma regulatory factor
MFSIEVDKGTKLLTIRYAGAITAEEVERCAADFESRLSELESGFRLLTDLTRLDSMEVKSVQHIRRMMDLANSRGVALVVRVIPDPQKDIGLNILSLFHYHRRVRILTCETLQQAMRALA